MLVEPRLEGGTPMISELRIPPGPVGDATAPHLEEGSTEQRDAGSRDKAEVPESFTSKELPRNNPTFTPTPPPRSLYRGLHLCGVSPCWSWTWGKLGTASESPHR